MQKKRLAYAYNKTVILLLKQIMRVIAYFFPRDSRQIVLGAWYGSVYGDSPKYLCDYLLEHTDYKLKWLGNIGLRDSIKKHPRLKFVEKDSLLALWVLLRSKIWICCISIEWDLTTWPVEGSAILINTWHGYSFKRNGQSTASAHQQQRRCSFTGAVVRFFEAHRRPWLMVGAERDASKLLEGDPRYFRADRILRMGTPTNDWLIKCSADANRIKELREKYGKLLGFDPEKKIIAYLPTWRTEGARVFSFYNLPIDRQVEWDSMLDRWNAILIEKHHYRTLEQFPVAGKSKCSIAVDANTQKNIDTNELLLITDILVSDYSGTYQDFGVLRRPCIHFMYDLSDYMSRGSGLVDGWKDMVAGPIVKTEIDLMTSVEGFLRGRPCALPNGFLDTIKYQTGNACKQLADFLERGAR